MINCNTLKKKREESGYNHQEIADLIGISRSYYTRIESGLRKGPKYEIIVKMAFLLNTTVSEITIHVPLTDGKVS